MTDPNLSKIFMQTLIEDLKSSKIYTDLQNAAQIEITKPGVRLSELKKGVQAGLIQSGWDKRLKNAVFKYLQTKPKLQYPVTPPEHAKEPLLYLRKAQHAWEKRILKSLNSMCTELNIPLARKRPEKEQKEMNSKWTELGVEGPDLTQIRPVYAPKDFLEVIVGIQNPNYHGDNNGFFPLWGIVQVPVKVKSINLLRLQYSEMAINQCQSGIDDSTDIPSELFDLDRSKLGKKVVNANHGPVAQEFSKKGCPSGLRATLWAQMLCVEVDDVDKLYYEQLKTSVLHHDLLVDSLLYKDVKLTATNDDQYFVFEDFLYQVLLPFSRDTFVLNHFSQNSATPPKSYIRGKLGVEEFSVLYPPNGVIPFHGFAMYAVSVCVSCFTLVAISAERYFAICRPLRSRTWQTLSHAYKTIIAIWMCALLLMIPIAAAQEIHPLQTGKKACREIWGDDLRTLQVIYSIFLVILLLIIPLCVMSMAYGAMSYKLWFTMKQQMQEQSDSNETFVSSNNEINMTSMKKRHYEGIANVSLRQTNVRSSNLNRKRVIKMLFVVVFEYFVCCSPMYILNTWKIVDYKDIHPRLSDAAWSLILLLFYASSFIHPITYCFMNKNFRKAFLCVFRCFIGKTKPLGRSCTEMSTMNTSFLPKRSNKMNKQSSQDLA